MPGIRSGFLNPFGGGGGNEKILVHIFPFWANDGESPIDDPSAGKEILANRSRTGRKNRSDLSEKSVFRPLVVSAAGPPGGETTDPLIWQSSRELDIGRKPKTREIKEGLCDKQKRCEFETPPQLLFRPSGKRRPVRPSSFYPALPGWYYKKRVPVSGSSRTTLERNPYPQPSQSHQQDPMP